MLVDVGGGRVADKSDYKGAWKSYRIIAFMRWVTLVLGPLPLIFDLLLEKYADQILQHVPLTDIITFEDILSGVLVPVLNPIIGIIVPDFDIVIYLPPITFVASILFVVFVVWTQIMKKKVRSAARDVVAERCMTTYGDDILY